MSITRNDKIEQMRESIFISETQAERSAKKSRIFVFIVLLGYIQALVLPLTFPFFSSSTAKCHKVISAAALSR